jgi:hypothetical protein
MFHTEIQILRFYNDQQQHPQQHHHHHQQQQQQQQGTLGDRIGWIDACSPLAPVLSARALLHLFSTYCSDAPYDGMKELFGSV